MENDVFNASLQTTDHNQMDIDAVASDIFSGPFIQSGMIDYDGHEQMICGNIVYPTLPEEVTNNPYITNHGAISNHASRGNASFEDSIGKTGRQIGASASATSLAYLLSGSHSLLEDLTCSGVSSALPLDEIRSLSSRACCDTFGPQDVASFSRSKIDDSMNGKLGYSWNCEETQDHRVRSSRTSTVHPSYHVQGCSEPGWDSNASTITSDHLPSSCVPNNELSLTLGSYRTSMMNMLNVPDQCSELSCSELTQVISRDSENPDASELRDSFRVFSSSQNVRVGIALGLAQTFTAGEELSLYRHNSSPFYFPCALLGSRYLRVGQQILTEIASYAKLDDLLSGIKGEARMSFSSSCSNERGIISVGCDEFPLSSGGTESQGHMDRLKRLETEKEKSQLLVMLQMIDCRYNQCLDQIQNVMSAFNKATESVTPQLHARFALHTISVIYKNLRERIGSRILLIGQRLSSKCTKEQEKTLESSLIQKQWTWQKMRKDQQSWRPQRGLPEKSVSVLRAWMFQNFLHPYPKDDEKHLLALKSGLTRSQVERILNLLFGEGPFPHELHVAVLGTMEFGGIMGCNDPFSKWGKSFGE
ncbi:homeobox protein ATH1 [Cocos nucifera]|uniref:Homeobox protein ATH1 n=1 Tax=Cocos nucifera TaxID=13894 RepID=A0A8K0IUA7_COCNU|nr:homeobox protein ATH1 [Cocos nucifera]